MYIIIIIVFMFGWFQFKCYSEIYTNLFLLFFLFFFFLSICLKDFIFMLLNEIAKNCWFGPWNDLKYYCLNNLLWNSSKISQTKSCSPLQICARRIKKSTSVCCKKPNTYSNLLHLYPWGYLPQLCTIFKLFYRVMLASSNS